MRKRQTAALVALVLLALVGHLMSGWAAAYYFEGYPTNGPFQVLNPLARMLQGELPGRDFPLFHGLLLQWTMLPSFLLLGKNLFASEWTRQVLPPVLAGLSLGLAAYALTANKARSALFALSLVALGTLMQTSERASLLMISHLVTAGNSLISYRSAFPLLLMALWGICYRDKALTGKSFVVLGGLLGLAPVWSYEQGVYAFTGLFVMGLYYLSLAPSQNWKAFVGALMAAVVVAGLSFSIITAGHGLETLSYAFGTIPKDQGWYFGAAPNRYLVSPELLTSTVVLPFFALAFLSAALGACAIYFHRIGRLTTPQVLVGLFISWQGVICLTSLTGMVTPSYAIPSVRAVLLLGFALACWMGHYLLEPIRNDLGRLFKGGLWLSAIGFTGLASVQGITAPEQRSQLPQFASSKLEPTLGVVLSDKYYKDIGAELGLYRNAPGKVFSAYVGPTDHILGQSNPSGVDYIIHALGDERRAAYVGSLASSKPEYVTTMRRSFFAYEQWLQNTSWPFYRELLMNYEPRLQTAYRVVWERAEPEAVSSSNCVRKDSSPVWMNAVSTTADKARLFELKIRYSVSNPWGRIPLLGTLARLEVNFSNHNMYAASLPLHKNEWMLPIVLRANQKLNLIFTQATLIPRFMADVESMELCEIDVPEARLKGLDDHADTLTTNRHPME